MKCVYFFTFLLLIPALAGASTCFKVCQCEQLIATCDHIPNFDVPQPKEHIIREIKVNMNGYSCLNLDFLKDPLLKNIKQLEEVELRECPCCPFATKQDGRVFWRCFGRNCAAADKIDDDLQREETGGSKIEVNISLIMVVTLTAALSIFASYKGYQKYRKSRGRHGDTESVAQLSQFTASTPSGSGSDGEGSPRAPGSSLRKRRRAQFPSPVRSSTPTSAFPSPARSSTPTSADALSTTDSVVKKLTFDSGGEDGEEDKIQLLPPSHFLTPSAPPWSPPGLTGKQKKGDDLQASE